MFRNGTHGFRLFLLGVALAVIWFGWAGATDQIHWTPLGAGGGGNSQTWGISPLDPNIILVGTDVGGIYRSTDGGLTWQAKNQVALRPGRNAGYGIGTGDGLHGHFTFNPPTGNQNVVYLGVWKSSDSGNTWAVNIDDTQVYGAGGATVDPVSPSIVYAFGYGNVYRSSDAFQSSSCQGSNAGGTQCAAGGIACRPGMKCYQQSCIVTTATCSGGTNNGNPCSTQAQCPSGACVGNYSTPGCINTSISTHGLVANPNGADRFNASLLACSTAGFFKSTDSGTTWSSLSTASSGLPTGLPGLCTGGTNPGSSCKADGDCGGGSCVSGICGGSDATCSIDANCPAGQTCQSGRCGGNGNQCRADVDCGVAGQVCKTLSCASMTMASDASHTIYATLTTRPFINGGANGPSGLDPWRDVDRWQGGVYKSSDFGATWTEANGANDGTDTLANRNPGFEQQPLGSAWVIPSADQAYVTQDCVGGVTHSGSCSIKIDYTQAVCAGGDHDGSACTTDANCTGAVSGYCKFDRSINTPYPGDPNIPNPLQVTGGTLYRIHAWYKVTNGSHITSLADVWWYDSNRVPVSWPGDYVSWATPWDQYVPTTITYANWQKFETVVRAPDRAAYAMIDFRGGVGLTYIDDVSFQATQDLPHTSGRGESPYFASYGDVAVPVGDTTGQVAYVSTFESTTAPLEGTDTQGIWRTLDGGSHWALMTRSNWHDNVVDNLRYGPVCGDGVCGGGWETGATCPSDCKANICTGGDLPGFRCTTNADCTTGGTCGAPPALYNCGDATCDAANGESRLNCPVDCYATGDKDPLRTGQNEICVSKGGYSISYFAPGCWGANAGTWALALGLPSGGTIPNNLVVLSGFQHMRSQDGGATWLDMTSSLYTAPTEEPGAGTYQGRGTNEVYTYFVQRDSRVNRVYYGDTDNRLGVSYNNGTSFSTEGWQWGGWYKSPQDTTSPLLPGDAATSIALDPNNANTIYVGTAAQAAYIQTEGNGDGYQSGVVKGTYTPKSGSAVGRWSWSRVGTLEAPPAGPTGGGLGGGIDLLYDTLLTQKLFAAYFSHGVFKTDPGATSSTPWTNTYTGSNWNPAPVNWYVYRIRQESTTGRLYVGAGNPLPPATYVIPDGETGVWESNDSGSNWCRISTTGILLDNDMGNEAVTDLVPMGPDSMLVATGVPVPVKYPIQSPALAYADAAGNYTGEGGIYKGIRTGNCTWTWTRVMRQPKVTGLAVSPTDRSTVYAFSGQGHPGGPLVIPGQKAGIYRSDDEGVTWYSVVNDGLANLFHGWLNFSDDPNTLYASTVGDGSFLGSRSCTNPVTEGASSPATCFDGVDNDCDGEVDYDCSFDATNQLLSSAVLVSGSVADLSGRPDRDAIEVVKEKLTGSTKPLDIIWTYSGMPTGKVYYLNVEGFKASDANDTFTFKSTTKPSGTCNGNESGYTNRITLGGPPDTDVAQRASIGTVSSSSPVVCIRVQDSGVSDGHQDTVSLDRVFLFPEPPEITATSDYQTVIGSITSGNYASTAASDDVRESLREALDTTVSPQVSRLEHIWRFDNVPLGSSHSLNLEGFRPAGGDTPKDDFQFSYSTDGINFSDISGALVNTLTEQTPGPYYSFGPSGVGGTIYIRVKDTNTTSGTSLDTVNIDRIAIKTTP